MENLKNYPCSKYSSTKTATLQPGTLLKTKEKDVMSFGSAGHHEHDIGSALYFSIATSIAT